MPGTTNISTGFLKHVRSIRTAGACEVLLGIDADSPPLPAASCVRLGLLDVAANMQALCASAAHILLDETRGPNEDISMAEPSFKLPEAASQISQVTV